jgi:hypothetical protein
MPNSKINGLGSPLQRRNNSSVREINNRRSLDSKDRSKDVDAISSDNGANLSSNMDMSPRTRLAYSPKTVMTRSTDALTTGSTRYSKPERSSIDGFKPNIQADSPQNDPLKSPKPKDLVLTARDGNNVLLGGSGNDTLIAYSDAGEPSVLGKQVVNQNEPLKNSNDTLIGGKGADTFLFALEMDGKQKFLTKHTQADGRIDGEGLAGENNKSHDHWLESIGDDTIADFNIEEGDKIDIKGHTVELFAIEKKGSDYVLRLRSNQGNADQNNPNGAHDGDLVGTITVKGAADKYSKEQLKSAINVDPTVHYVVGGRGVETVKADPLLGSGTTTGLDDRRDSINNQKTTNFDRTERHSSSGSYSEIMAPSQNDRPTIFGNPMISYGTNNSSGMDFSNLNGDRFGSQLGLMPNNTDSNVMLNQF